MFGGVIIKWIIRGISSWEFQWFPWLVDLLGATLLYNKAEPLKKQTNKQREQALWITPEKCWVDQMAQLQTGFLLVASSSESAGGKLQGIFWEGTSNKWPQMVGSHSSVMQLELRAQALEARDICWQAPSQVCLLPEESSLSPFRWRSLQPGGHRPPTPVPQTSQCPAGLLLQTFFPSMQNRKSISLDFLSGTLRLKWDSVCETLGT